MNVKDLLIRKFEHRPSDIVVAVSVRKIGQRSVLFEIDGYLHVLTRCLNSKVAAEKEFDTPTIYIVRALI